LNPWHEGRAEIIPFRYKPVLLGGRETERKRERGEERKAEELLLTNNK
jgi:hypothetical protein